MEFQSRMKSDENLAKPEITEDASINRPSLSKRSSFSFTFKRSASNVASDTQVRGRWKRAAKATAVESPSDEDKVKRSSNRWSGVLDAVTSSGKSPSVSGASRWSKAADSMKTASAKSVPGQSSTKSGSKFAGVVKTAQVVSKFQKNSQAEVQASRGSLSRTTSLGIFGAEAAATGALSRSSIIGLSTMLRLTEKQTREEQLREGFRPPDLEKMQARENMIQSKKLKNACASEEKILSALFHAEERIRKYDKALQDYHDKQTGEFYKTDEEKALEEKMHAAYRELFQGDSELSKDRDLTRVMSWAEADPENFVYKKDGTIFGNPVRGYTKWSNPNKNKVAGENGVMEEEENTVVGNHNLLKTMRGAEVKNTKESGRSWRNAVHQRYRPKDNYAYHHGVIYPAADEEEEAESIISEGNEVSADVLEESVANSRGFGSAPSEDSQPGYSQPGYSQSGYGQSSSGFTNSDANQDQFRHLFPEIEEEGEQFHDMLDSETESEEDQDDVGFLSPIPMEF